MSGIGGICKPGGKIERDSLRPMLAALAIGGESAPQEIGNPGVMFAVVPRWPHQQLTAAQNIKVAASADLHNLDDIRNLLADKGIATHELSVAEIIASLYRVLGPQFVTQLDGSFSFAIWDEHSSRLMLAVDHLGIDALYWTADRERILFASRSSAVAAVMEETPEINESALMQYLMFSVVTAPLSIYKGVERLRPGHFLLYEDGRLRQEQYWDLKYVESKDRNEQRWASKVREGIRSAVHRGLTSLDPSSSGAYLSGGTDSSSVVGFMSERFSPVNAFSIVFPEGQFDESFYAQTAAKHFGAKHITKRLTPEDAVNAIPKIIKYYDEPFANSSAIGGYYCALLAREHGVSTLLAGDGGDELFGGNQRYEDDKVFSLYHEVPRWIRRGLIEPLAGLLPENAGRLSRARSYVRRANIPNPRRMLSYNMFLSTPARTMFTDDFLSQAPPDGWLSIVEDHYQKAVASSDLNRILHLDIKVTLSDNDLRKVVGTAELAGVKARFPLLDRRLADLSGELPANLKLKGFKKRFIFKEAMKAILPPEILQKKKHGFGVPLGAWFLQNRSLNNLLGDIVSDRRTRQRGYFRPEFLDQLTGPLHREHPGYYGEIVWYLMVLELWHREHLESLRRTAVAH